MNYYNEIDRNAAAWLRELIAMKAIPDGRVDERSITDVTPNDLAGFTQCHFFAGIAGWSLALERAGITATRPLWTGSCPCQAFSCAGKQKGVRDHRDLWPEFFRLIRECQPDRIFGEQVEAAVGHGWLDRLSADMEAENYAVGSVVLGAHSAGADHQRQRLYWVADAGHAQVRRSAGCHETTGRRACGEASGRGDNGGLADSKCNGGRSDEPGRRQKGRAADGRCCQTGELVNPTFYGPEVREHVHGELQRFGPEERRTACGVVLPGEPGPQGHARNVNDGREPGRLDTLTGGHAAETGAHGRNFWSNAVAIPCRDNCFRRAEPGIFPLVARLPRGVVPSGDHRLPGYADETSEGRVMRLKGYGNAINVETARLFIEACEDTIK